MYRARKMDCITYLRRTSPVPSAFENTCALIIRQSPKLGTRSAPREPFPHSRDRRRSPPFPRAYLFRRTSRASPTPCWRTSTTRGGPPQKISPQKWGTGRGARVLLRGGDRVPNFDLAYRARRKYFDTGLALPMYIQGYLGQYEDGLKGAGGKIALSCLLQAGEHNFLTSYSKKLGRLLGRPCGYFILYCVI